MSEILTMEQIEKRCDSEWVLLEDPETTETLEITRAKLLFHSKDRDEVYRKAFELRPTDYALFYVGKIPEGTAIIL